MQGDSKCPKTGVDEKAGMAPDPDTAVCVICKGAYGKWWPHLRTVVRCAGVEVFAKCHVECAYGLLERQCATGHDGDEVSLTQTSAEQLRELARLCPPLFGMQPSFRVCYEELRLEDAVKCWPPLELPAPPPVAFTLENISEIRISSCPALRSIPPEVGLCRGMKALVLISNNIESIPKEVGMLEQLDQLFLNGNFLRGLPEEVGRLPVLEEICLDSNLITALPPFTSPKLTLFTAPANKMEVLPPLAGRLDRLDVHGNALHQVIPLGSQVRWDKLRNIKLMGNKLCALPEEFEQMWALRTILVSGNRLKTLPACITKLPDLEWLFAYNNEISELPVGILSARWLDRVLLEGNPLSGPTMEALLKEAASSSVKVLALDIAQVRTYAASTANWTELPVCVSVGNLVHSPEAPQYYMKLVRASQLRRQPGTLAPGEPGGPPDPETAPAELLVVAFAASQGEPEWLGVLRRLGLAGRTGRLPPVEGHIAAEVGDLSDPAAMKALWALCEQGKEGGSGAKGEAPSQDASGAALGDFDVLGVIDSRMQWYDEDAAAFSGALRKIAAQHRRVLFVGASMGGFGALRHGRDLADAVLAFGPQSRLDHATLRPPGADLQALAQLSQRVRESVRTARARGARIEVHCAADEHCWHGLSLPLGDLCLTVHPLVPRKPFARLLDRAQMLAPILSDTICRLLSTPPCREGQCEASPGGAGGEDLQGVDADARVLIARWWYGGGFSRFTATRDEALRLFFGQRETSIPRPGDWFCPLCHRRNAAGTFFCRPCNGPNGAKINDAGVKQIPGGREYPRKGDWGCGKCGAAMCGYDWKCSSCWSTRDHEKAVIVT